MVLNNSVEWLSTFEHKQQVVVSICFLELHTRLVLVLDF
jgi:hypothetical protein